MSQCQLGKAARSRQLNRITLMLQPPGQRDVGFDVVSRPINVKSYAQDCPLNVAAMAVSPSRHCGVGST